MAIPKFTALRIESLKMLSDGAPRKIKDFIEPLASRFHLSPQDVSLMYPSGNGNIFYDRISWALSYLYMAGLIVKPSRGVYVISEKGREMAASCPADKINEYIEKAVQARTGHKAKKTGKSLNALDLDSEGESSTPQESLYRAFENIKNTVYSEILTTIIGKSSREFEKLVVQLLQIMGYGGEVKDSGYVTKATSDGGIDGIIKEDVLGFGRIHIQAKRYGLDNPVQRPEVQKFVGALAVAQSNKGVFITTSTFSRGAVEYVENLNGSATIVLVDGRMLAQYIYDYGLGMQTEQTIRIKKLDADFWDTMEDDRIRDTADKL